MVINKINRPQIQSIMPKKRLSKRNSTNKKVVFATFVSQIKFVYLKYFNCVELCKQSFTNIFVFFLKKGVWIMNSAVHEQGQTVIKKKRETTAVPHAASLKLVLCVSIDSLFHLPIFTGSVFLSLC